LPKIIFWLVNRKQHFKILLLFILPVCYVCVMNIFKIAEKLVISRFDPKVILVLGFVSAAIAGTILLSMPFSLTGEPVTFIDIFFTAASAACINGLMTVDISRHFTFTGQLIIMVLIQIGGLGIMSFSTLFLLFLRGKFAMNEREIVLESLSLFETTDVSKLFKSVFVFTFLFETVGAIILTARFSNDMPFQEALFSGCFHSIAAFCNAGISIFPDGLMQFRSDIVVNIIIMILIAAGGIGFVVMYELSKFNKKKFAFFRLSLHTKTALLFSGGLILLGALLLFITEYNVSMQGFDFKTRILSSLFQSVTSRSAGYNTLDVNSFSVISLLIIISLMFIGASPASCGGGIKVSTIAVIIAFIRSRINDVKNVNLFYSTIPFHIISRAILVMVFGIITVLVFSLLISIIELSGSPFYLNSTKFLRIFFEVVSAFGTTGLSTGITSSFSEISKFLLSFLMLIGRIGPLTLVLAAGSKEIADIKYSEDNILVG